MKKYIALLLCLFICLAPLNGLAATKGEQNALSSAKGYLSFTHFSYKGLMDQLEYEGYSYTECKYAADNCGADWYDQAAGSAKDYMSFSSFSKKGLVEQLEYEGYTKDEAEYGAAVAYGENPTKPYSKSSYTAPSNDSVTDDSDEGFIEFDPTLTELIDSTASVWFSSSSNRALLSVLLTADYMLALSNLDDDDKILPDLVQSSFVGKDGLDLVFISWSDNNVIIIVYRPTSGKAEYHIRSINNIDDDDNRDFITELLLTSTTDNYYKNDLEDIADVASQLSDIFS